MNSYRSYIKRLYAFQSVFLHDTIYDIQQLMPREYKVVFAFVRPLVKNLWDINLPTVKSHFQVFQAVSRCYPMHETLYIGLYLIVQYHLVFKL